MIEIVFGDSACGGLKMAQNYGVGNYNNQTIATGIIITHHDGSKATEEEYEAAKKEWEKRDRMDWENAVPMNGDPGDVYGFHYSLSIGDISEDIPGEKRIKCLDWLYSIYPDTEGDDGFTSSMIQNGIDVLKEICERISNGESVRIWYSDHPDELCGMYCFMSHITKLQLKNDQVVLVKLPEWKVGENKNLTKLLGWGSIKPGEWGQYVDLQQPVSLEFCNNCATHWNQLQKENSPLRAMINGHLMSVPENLYDEFITQEIHIQPDEFDEAMLIGTVLGKYELCIGDSWIAHRIEKMIASEILEPITQANDDSPMYYRRLRKCKK